MKCSLILLNETLRWHDNPLLSATDGPKAAIVVLNKAAFFGRQYGLARANLQRNEELVAQNFVAQRVLDESRASLQVAEAQVALAQARLGRMRIVAPFDGTVGIRTVNLGDYVKDGADLVNLEDTSTLYVDFRMPERYQGQLAVGQAVKVQIDALPGRDFTAKVQALEEISARLGISPADAVAVGDGANDLGMLGIAGMGVALHAKPSVQAECAVRVNHGDLTALLYLQGYRREEFLA